MAVDIFLQIPKVSGESTDAQFKGQIEIVSWGLSLSQAGSAGSGTGSGTGKVNIGDLNLVKYADKSTPVLFAASCAGTAYPQAVLSIRKAGGTKPLVYLVVTLGNVTVSGQQHATSTTDDRHTEHVTLHFGTIKMEYTPQNADGSGGAVVTTTWNIPGNSASV
jgi:type VI secretion system secreted protein Hcp